MALPSDFLEIDFTEDLQSSVIHKRLLPFADSEIYRRRIKSFRKLTQSDDVKAKYHIVLDIEHVKHAYKPGDSIGIIPTNNKEEVNKLIERLHLSECADKIYNLKILKGTLKKKPVLPPHLPVRGTVKDIFLSHVDLRAVPKKLFLRALVPYCDDRDKDVLKSLSDMKSASYEEFITNKARSLLDMLEALPSCQPPIERLLEHLPPLHPRFYSISSSPLNSTELHFAFSLVDCGKVKGVCTGYLESILGSQEEVPFYFRKHNESLNGFYQDGCKAILVGPGTGVAPFIGYLEHAVLQKRNVQAALYFGCRFASKDHIYKAEMDGFLAANVLNELHVALSRDNKEYVQDVIARNGKDFAGKLVDGAGIWVCGSREMAREVQKTAIRCLVEFRDFSEKDAAEFIAGLQKENVYVVDVWT